MLYRMLALLSVASVTAQTPYVDGSTAIINMHGAGTTNPQRLFWESMDLLTDRAKLPMRMTYRAVGSSTGQKEFNGDSASSMQPYNHFGAGDIPMTSSRYASITGSGRTMVHVPFAMGAIGVFHSVPSSEVGGPAIDLDGCLLAKIFSRQITRWEDPELRAANPSMTAVGDIRVYHRVRGSSSTAGFTEYLSSKCPASWTLGSGSTITWPAGTFEAQGSGGMADAIENNAYSIGYIDAGHGHERGFGEIALLNAAGVYLTTLQAVISDAAAPALAAGVIPADPTADFSAVNLYDQTGAATWPITMISYFYLNKNLTSMDAHSASVLMYFVRYILSDEGQTLAESNMFSRLPAELVTYNTATLASIMLPAGYVDFFTEMASDTQIWLGANAYVFSGKRQSWGHYERTQLESRVAAVETAVAAADHSRLSMNTPYVDGDTTIINMHGAGTTNPQRLFWEAMGLLTDRAKLPMRMTYRAVGSSTGQKEFNGDDRSGHRAYNHFGAGDIPMTSSRYASITGSGRTMVHVPFAMGAIGVFHSVPSSEVGGPAIDLDGCLLAKIFSRQITRWEDPELRAANPSMTAVGDIRVYHRVRGSSSTAGFTEYLSSKCPASWTLGSGSTITWPAGTFEAQGSGGMADAIENNAYSIGYIDAGHGHERGFGEIALLNAAGVYLTTLQAVISDAAAPALAAGVIPADPTADFSAVNLYDQTGAATWPITMISYFYLNKNLTSMDAHSASVLMYFVRYILSDEGQTLAESNMFSRLPAELVTYNTATLASIMLPAGYVDFFTEMASDTQIWLGANAYVFSGKRQSYAAYERGQIESDIDDLRAHAAAPAAAPPALSPRTAITCFSDFCFTEDELANIAVGGFVMAVLSLVIGILGACVGCMAINRLNTTNAPMFVGVPPSKATPSVSNTSAGNGV